MAAAKSLRKTMPEKPLLFTFRSAKEVRFYTDGDMPWTLDGELEPGHREITASNLHHAIRLVK